MDINYRAFGLNLDLNNEGLLKIKKLKINNNSAIKLNPL